MTDQLILVVEDDPIVRLVAQKQLRRLGYDCKTVATGERALECDDDDIALIFMDIGLPGIDGIQTTRLIREREQHECSRRVPIVALTAHSDREQCLRAGMDDYLQKPALLNDLKQRLEKWLPARAPAVRAMSVT